MAKEIKFKGKKVYGISKSKEESGIICLSDDFNSVRNALDSRYDVLIEFTATRVFTRDHDLKEIEREIP